MLVARLKLDKDDIGDVIIIGEIRLKISAVKDRRAEIVIDAPANVKITREKQQRPSQVWGGQSRD